MKHKRNDQTDREAVGERAVEPASLRHAHWLPIKEPRAERSNGPSERSALTRSRPKATFFREFLFCQKRKLPLAGKALTPQTKEEPTQSPRTENRKQKTENRKQKTQQSNRKR
ncbi:MAG: hypothetical protein Q7T07_01435 [Burkholderiaceae bacterium]|nr:hypothetical protein [Burkholderiaceae bacterium]